jgi:transcriptional regulator with XRE-family HTH domain
MAGKFGKGETDDDRARAPRGALASGIRSIRQRQGLTVASLAARAELNKGYLSRVERGEKAPSIAALLRIAEALDVGVGHLFGEAAQQDSIRIARSGEWPLASGGADGESLAAIFPPVPGQRVSAFLFEPSATPMPRQADHPGDEMLFVLAGTVEVAFSDRIIALSANDSVLFNGHLKHRVRRVGEAAAHVLIIIGRDISSASG